MTPLDAPDPGARGPRNDLAVVVLSMNEAHWLRALLPTLEASIGGLSVDVVVADVESTDDTAAVVDACSIARRVPVRNGGFAHANNAAALTVNARHVLFLNSDTEIQRGSFDALLGILDTRPAVGMLGVRQVDASGVLFPTMRRFASVRRRLAEVFWAERFAPHLGMRVLDPAAYEVETECDWTIGSFMLVRGEALASAGFMDERFFFTGEEADLCLRIRQAGWTILHVPDMTIVHHVGKRGPNSAIEAQMAYSERLYAAKHFGAFRRRCYLAVMAINYATRSIPGVLEPGRRASSRRALRVILGREGAPFGDPPATALPSGVGDAVFARIDA